MSNQKNKHARCKQNRPPMAGPDPAMQPSYHELDRCCEAVVEEFIAAVTQESDSTQVVYHYTDLSALLGILENGELWATHHDYMNDIGELTIGPEVFEQIFRERSQHAGLGDPEPFLEGMHRMQLKNKANVYMTCFSTKKDHTGQWKTYAPKNGVTIGFELKGLHGITKADELFTATFLRVRYGAEEQRRLLEAPVGKLIAKLNEVGNSIEGEQHADATERTFQMAFLMVMAIASVSFKHCDFEDEDEWRLFVTRSKKHQREIADFREGKYGLMPYLKIPLGEKPPIRELVVSAGLYTPKLHGTLEMLLEKHGLGDVKIECSKSPYR